MRQGSDLEDIAVKLDRAAHHEAGHIVIAAVQVLRLRPAGLMVDQKGKGLACYCKQPDDSDLSREHCIVASLAGFKAEERFCEEHSCPAPHWLGVIGSGDSIDAREISTKLSVPAIYSELENRSARLVEQHWAVITALAAALLAKDWEPLKPLKSGGTWAEATAAKYLPGEEVVGILARYGIVAVYDPTC